MAWTIYIATNKANGKQYVGLTKHFKRRLREHLRAERDNAFHGAIRKYGVNGFVFSEICSAFDFEAACDLERMFIKQHGTMVPTGYNLTSGGEGVSGVFTSEETKEKISQANSGRKHSEEHKEKNRKAQLGHKVSEETKEKIRQAQLGLKHSEERREKNRQINLGRKHSEETKKKMSQAHLGRKHSEESKEKMRGRKLSEEHKEKLRGPKHSEETKEKLRQAHLGRKLSEETKEKMRQAKKRAARIAEEAIAKAQTV